MSRNEKEATPERDGAPQMTFDEILTQVLALLQREGRVTYRALKRRFGLDDDYLEDLRGEIIKAKRLATDEDGEVLVWTGTRTEEESETRGIGESGKKQIYSYPLRYRWCSVTVVRVMRELFCTVEGQNAQPL